MSLPELLSNTNTVCGKDLAEEGEIIEDSDSCASSPKSSKEPVIFNSISIDKKELNSSDRKYSDFHKTDEYNRTHRSSNSNTSSSRHRSRSREHKRHRSNQSEERSRYSSSRSHRDYKDDYYSSRSSRDDRKTHSYSDSRHRSRHDSPDKRSRRSTPERKQTNGINTTKDHIKNETEKPGILKKVPEIASEPEIEFDFEDPIEKENRLIEERRKKRQAILEKHKHLRTELNASSPAPSLTSEQDASFSNDSPFDLTKQNPCPVFTPTKSDSRSPEVSCLAADYNPNDDRIADYKLYGEVNDEKDFLKTQNFNSHKETTQSIEEAVPKNESANAAPLDDFDMFGEEDCSEILAFNQAKTTSTLVPAILVQNPALQDNWDDFEGYYRITLGEILADRYHVFSVLGKGVFSSVVKAKDTKDSDKLVAIKIIRCNETMHRLGLKETDILKKLSEADPKNKRHVVRLFDQFEYRGHLCLVFESLSMNLREVLKKFGKDVGIAIKAVRAYAQQLFLALSLLEKCNIVHADIKPDNILVSESHNTLKLCDLGSASYSSDNEITPYLVSRFYRAPEIILGLPYNAAIDVWSAGCSLFEMYTGKILFPGRTNNHMLKLMIDLKGRFPNKMVKRGGFAFQHFNEDYNFLYVENSSVKKIAVPKAAQKELKQRILGVTSNTTEEELRLTHLLVDFLDRCLQINPEQRLTVKEALSHPFLH